jgi:Cu2+-containing amine oxidase
MNVPKPSRPLALCAWLCISALPAMAQRTPVPSAPLEGGKPEQARALPLDPLTEQETHEAEQVALADSRVQELLGKGRRKTVSVDLTAIKPSQEGVQAAAAGRSIPMGRFAVVVFFRYEGEVGVRAVVDLTRRTVTEVARLSGDQVPMNADDLAEAWQLARRDEEVRRALGAEAERYEVERTPPKAGATAAAFVVRALRVRGTEEKDPCFRDRCLQLFFSRGNKYLMQPTVIVDLSSQKVYIQRREK